MIRIPGRTDMSMTVHRMPHNGVKTVVQNQEWNGHWVPTITSPKIIAVFAARVKLEDSYRRSVIQRAYVRHSVTLNKIVIVKALFGAH